MLVSQTEKPPGERNEENWRRLQEKKQMKRKKKDKKKTGKKNIFIEAKQLAAQLHVWVA